MAGIRPWIARAYWGTTLLVLGTAVTVAIRAPVENTFGPIQKIFYLHLPIAINTFLSGFVVFVACVAYLGGRQRGWDDLAHAAARVTVLNGTVLLLTGVFWAKVSWGQWWAWSPRLAFSLLLWLLYVVYLVLRPMFGTTPKGAVIASVYGVIAFLDVPLVYLSVNLLPDVHPAHLELTGEMKQALALWFVSVTMLTGGLIGSRFALTRQADLAPALTLKPRAASQGHAA